jgi:dephospho-CoA kinase
MIKIGLTGGIGSGKSVICQVFARLGVPVYYADTAARELSEADPEIRQKLTALLGSDAYTGTSLNRKKIASLIFGDKRLLASVNQIIHPKVAEDFTQWCLRQAHPAYVIQESAILFESMAYRMMDRYLTIYAPEEIRMERTLARRDMTIQKLQAIMQNQLPEQEKIRLSHHVIINDGLKPVLPQILNLHNLFLTLTPNSPV